MKNEYTVLVALATVIGNQIGQLFLNTNSLILVQMEHTTVNVK